MNNNQHQLQQQRPLEDVLRDPNASWGEIREAMKSSRGCTNVAIMGAIAKGRGVALVSDGDSDVNRKKFTFSDAVTVSDRDVAPPSSLVIDVDSAKEATEADDGGQTTLSEEKKTAGEVVVDTVVIPLTDGLPKSEAKEDVTNSRNRRPSRRSSRRSSFRGSKTSSRRASWRRPSSNGSNDNFFEGSVNMMDFGVDNNILMKSLKESASDSGSLNQMSSMAGGLCDHSESSDCGFLGWNHDDSSQRSSMHSNYSDFVDSSGFLDWDRTKKKTEEAESPGSFSPIQVRSIVNGFSAETNRRPIDTSKKSFKDSFSLGKIENVPEEQWHIEDYEDPRDNIVDTKKRWGGFFGNNFQLRRNSSGAEKLSETNQAQERKPEEINMDKVKEALFKVANFAEQSCRSAPSSRRASAENLKEDCTEASKTRKPRRRRRQTIMGMPCFLGGGGGEAERDIDNNHPDPKSGKTPDSSENKRPAHRSHLHILTTDDSHRPSQRSLNHTVDGNSPPAGRHTIISGLPLFPQSEKAPEKNMWNDDALRQSCREAIWINPTDGNFDIVKERRKLYSEEEDKKDHKGSGFRATLLGRPRLLSKGNLSDVSDSD
eukprot:CAMPEP_0183745574 /NCGR_PEP_ID=MMETSP0737-20130205/66316_1 /TAXON_ID=385413 /ORGANISM="Thalassiosira miniscula, Strain CCMP1093" /LENGTH=598 /DNA_ID=CAMNT_0025981249 /DNA_START=107 /DNA_END=1903 /DNA_ORIENTATION=-